VALHRNFDKDSDRRSASTDTANVFMPPDLLNTASSSASASSEELAGNVHPFTQALGSPESLASLAALADLVQSPKPESLPAVHAFLARYADRLLTAVELPAIRDAYHHLARGEIRDLIALDRRLSRSFGESALAEASRMLGRTQLRRLRPLRSRPLQRYLDAVASGKAHGWHVIVYGVLLALFSLPLRQGLAHFAHRSQRGLLDSILLGLRTNSSDRQRLQETCDGRVAPALDQTLPASPFTLVSSS